MKLDNSVKSKLIDKSIMISGMVRLPNPTYATILANAGVENIIIDNEHFPFTDDDIKNIAIAIHLQKSNCLVRVNKKNLESIYRILDMGVDGVIIPNVETKEEAITYVEAIKYPPTGKRGCCPITFGADYGIISTPSYYTMANNKTIIGIMIESCNGVENLDAILEVEGVDFFSIGPSDFSGSLGKPGQAGTDKQISEIMKNAYLKMVAAGYSVSGLAYTAEQARNVLNSHRNILNIGSELQILSKEFLIHIQEANAKMKELGYLSSKKYLKQKLKDKEPLLLPYMRIADPSAVEIACLAGIKHMVIDNEHFSIDDKQLSNMIRACHSHQAECIVRVYDKSPIAISRIIDMGADGIIAPQVNSYEEAKEIVRAAKRSNESFYSICNNGELNKDIVVGIMVETKNAVEDLDKILTIEGLDYISVGPSDISASYGMPGQYDNPFIKQIMSSVWNKISQSKIALAGQCYSTDKIEQAIKDGKTVLNIGSDLQYLIWGTNRLVSDIETVIKEENFEKSMHER